MDNKNTNLQISKEVISQIREIFSFIEESDFEIKIDKKSNIKISRLSDKKFTIINHTQYRIENIMTKCPKWIGYLENKFTETFIGQGIEKSIPDAKQKWIVKLKSTCNPNDCLFPAEIKIKNIYCVAYHGICCKASEASMMNFIKNHENVEDYVCDQKVYLQVLEEKQIIQRAEMSAFATQPIPPFIKKIGADHSSQKSGIGSSIGTRTDINVFIFDTGISSHPDLNIVGGRNFTTGDSNAWQDQHGHGTHVSGIAGAKDNDIGIIGVAPGVRLWAIKVIGNNGSGSTSVIIAALNWVLSNRGTLWNGYGIINMSLGGPVFQPLDDAIKNITNNGIVVCVAAGNSSINAINITPARSLSAITVGATSSNPFYDTLASYSNYGSIIDILAPGSNIYSTYLNNSYSVMSGTSMATPILTGTIALLVSTLNLGPPTTADFVGNVSNTIKYVSSFLSYPNYDGTETKNPRIKLSVMAKSAITTDISIRSGTY